MRLTKKSYILPALAAGFFLTAAPASATIPLAEKDTSLNLYYDDEELVESATRAPKPISQVAENVTIITAQEIEDMNAHTVSEVLDRVAGMFNSFGSREIIPSGSFSVHNSESEQVTVLIDGIRWRYTYDITETNQIPVRIIKRIEVIKGPASSTWGSSLGGVVNIITRDTGKEGKPTGLVSGSYGEFATHDLRADTAGRTGKVGYYLYAGSTETDGGMNHRYFRNKSVYGKTDLELTKDTRLTVSGGYTAPESKYLHWQRMGFDGYTEERDFFVSGALDMQLTPSLSVNFTARRYDNEFANPLRAHADGSTFSKNSYDLITTGASARVVYTRANQTVVVGGDFDRWEEKDTDHITPYMAPTLYDEYWGVYANNTIRWNDFTITPGIRFDHFSLSDNQTSPSLGITYRATPHTLLRLIASQGFRKPPASFTSGDPWFVVANPELDPEKVASLQAGIETTALRILRLKTTAFRHVAKGVWEYGPSWEWVNGGKERRKGVEIEAETVPLHNLSIVSNYAYTRREPGNSGENDATYAWNAGLRYDDQKSLRAELFGHYIWYGTVRSRDALAGHYDDFLWDFNLRKTFLANDSYSADLFATVHNLFNGSQYFWYGAPNTPRWAEAGIRVRY